jgi:glycosyltransferase involved in cell wall biosynthesis
MVNLLESKPEVALVYADVAVTLNENETLESADIIGYFRWPDYNPKLLFKVCYVGPQPMWRKSLHDRYGYFDPMFKSAGDYEFWLRLAAKNEKFYHLPECLGLYLNSTYGMENSNTDLSFEESEMARVRNWKSTMGERPTPVGNYFVPELGQNPLVTIIVPTANRPELLIYALNSLIAQIYQNWEAIVVNDGGIGVSKLAETLDSKGRIKCLEHFTSFGPAAARNTALRLASGKIICYLDDDDVYLPHHLSTIVNAFHETSTSFIFTDSDHVVEKVQNGNRLEIVRKPAYPYSADQLGRLNEHLYVSNIIPINTWAHLRVCLIKTGFFDEALPSHEDWDLLLRFSKHYEFVHIPVVTTEIRERQDAADNVSSRQKHTYIEVFQKIYSRNKDLNTEFVINGRKSILKYLGHVKTQSYSAVILMNAKRFLDRYVYWRFRSFRRRPQ